MPLHLVWRYLGAHKLRTLLTVGSLVVAFFLVCSLQALVSALSAGIDTAATNRLMVQSAVSLFVSLPLSYQQKIEAVEGVDEVCKFQWFGGVYQDEGGGFFAQFAVDPQQLMDTYPEHDIVDGSLEKFLSDRTACLIGDDLRTIYGFRVGQRIPLLGTIFPRQGDEAWEFDVAAIYSSDNPAIDEQRLYFHYDYLREALESGAASGPEGVGVYAVRIEQGADPVRVMSAIDAKLETPQRVQTTTEAEFQRQFVTMLGSVPTLLGSIGGGVLFAILLAVVNTMLVAARERTRDLGILKALGFTDGTAFGLLMAESLLLTTVGGGLGIGLALLGERAFLHSPMAAMFQSYAIEPSALALSAALALAIGLVAGIVPAWSAARLQTVEAVRADV